MLIRRGLHGARVRVARPPGPGQARTGRRAVWAGTSVRQSTRYGMRHWSRQLCDIWKGSNTWLSAASTSAGPRAFTPDPPPSSSARPRPPASP
ncbi:hypothetical protein DEJ49_27800 [Streptomyces venezuelae]|uniref:Uncharacterized protein n=1 Tax=Streptomyces venezuelae TaxID=54571 RepID=A0A5P2CWY5_STRVZ|nr:hypothetical protein DEJ49_27800 [Streptomyces venezuelae]